MLSLSQLFSPPGATIPKQVLSRTATSGTYTFVAADAGQLDTITSTGSVTCSIPLNSSVSFNIGDELMVVRGALSQTLTIAGVSGVTVVTDTSVVASVQGTLLRARQLATDVWYVTNSRGTGATAQDLIVALGDETTAIVTGTAVVTLRAPRAMTLSKIKASLTVASLLGIPKFDVKLNGTSLFSTLLTIDASEKTSETAATPAVLATTAIAGDDELTFDIVTSGSGAKGAKITLVSA